MSGLSLLLERPDIYNGLYLLGKKRQIHTAERTCWRTVFHLLDGFFGGKCLYIYKFFFLESQKMDSDIIASILIKCHKIEGSRDIFFYQLNFCCQNLLNEASDFQFSAHDLPQMDLH